MTSETELQGLSRAERMGDCQYVRDYYGVPACIGRAVICSGRPGIIAADRGHYIGVRLDGETAINNYHPTDQIEYGGLRQAQALTAGQKRYQSYLDADCGLSFIEYLRSKP